ncbi:MAG: hypothetical protein JOY98_16270 [Candidatus Eremiobacteraeota bacterium]|nr:hypothetical protein [Candidatus Eremiobacteraeota bacterium]
MIVFLPCYVAVLALLYLELRGVAVVPSIRLPRWPAWAWIAVLVVSYAASLGIVWYAAATVAAAVPWRQSLPIPVAEHGMAHPDAVEAALLALAAVQTFALAGLYQSAASRAVLTAGLLGILALSLAAPAFVSPDPYAYVGDALLGRAAYAPPVAPFAGEFASIDRLFHPLLPAPYGPVWLALARWVTDPFPALAGKLMALRALGALSYLGLLAALRAYGVPSRILAVAAVNPLLAQQYVADAHNDLLGIAVIVAAAALLRVRRTDDGAIAVAVSALVKLPFVAIALPIFARIRGRAARCAWYAATVAAAVLVSWWGGGAAYFRGLTVHVPAAGAVYFFNAAVAIAAISLLVLAAAGARRLASALWIVPMMGSYVATWYMLYGLPYALARRRLLAYLLIALPVASALVDAKFMRPWTYFAALPVTLAVSLLFARRRWV